MFQFFAQFGGRKREFFLFRQRVKEAVDIAVILEITAVVRCKKFVQVESIVFVFAIVIKVGSIIDLLTDDFRHLIGE